MQFKKISSIVEYTAFLIKKYNELRMREENNIYRIIEIKETYCDQYKIVIQVIGKSSIIECSPHEIVTADRLLEGFSKRDIRTITYFACQQIKNPRYKIITQDFHENRMLFKIKEATSNTLVTKSASQIMMDKNVINNLSLEDINSVSYVAGYEGSLNEATFIENITKL